MKEININRESTRKIFIFKKHFVYPYKPEITDRTQFCLKRAVRMFHNGKTLCRDGWNYTGYIYLTHIPTQFITFKSALLPACSHTYIISPFDLTADIEFGNVYEQGARVILECVA
jgi:hypothetical protein